MFGSLSLQLENLALKNQEMLVTLSTASLTCMCICIYSNHCHNIRQYKKCLFCVKGRNIVYQLSREGRDTLYKADSESNLLCPNH